MLNGLILCVSSADLFYLTQKLSNIQQWVASLLAEALVRQVAEKLSFLGEMCFRGERCLMRRYLLRGDLQGERRCGRERI